MAKITYKATYRDPKQNPFTTDLGLTIPTKTVQIDESVSFEEVEAMARQASDGLEFVKVEVVK
jgi:hypothetical protein